MNKLKRADKAAEEMMEIFEASYQEITSDFDRLETFQQMYENVINAASWPTTSQMPIPLHFVMVERALPAALNYLFPRHHFVSLTPMDENVDVETVNKVERALQYTVMNKVKLHQAAFGTIKDCFKLGIGYGIVEPCTVTPPAAFVNQYFRDGEPIARAKTMGIGAPQRSVRYRHITPGQIIVTQDGAQFNGPDRVSVAFFVDVYPEHEFRALYDKTPQSGDEPIMKGSVNDIIEEARELGFDARVPIVDLVAKIGGLDIRKTNKPKESVPVCVPVIKCYSVNRHIWIANGTRTIFDMKDKFQTLRCPLVKASSTPDGKRWFPMSAIEASEKMMLGVNIWVNAMFDLLTYIIKPMLAYDKTKTGSKPPERGPNADIGLAGPVRDALQYVEPPPMPAQLFTIGDMLQQFCGSAMGQENFLNNPVPGLVRGGANAFESLLQSTTGREQLAGAVLDSGFVQPAIEQILIYMQLGASREGEVFRMRKWNRKTKAEYNEEMRVTEDDLVHAYDLSLNLRAKMRNSAAEQAKKQAEFSVLNNDPYIDQYELRKRLIDDEDEADRLLVSRDEAERKQKELYEAQRMKAMETGAAPQTKATSQQEQQIAGAAAMGGTPE